MLYLSKIGWITLQLNQREPSMPSHHSPSCNLQTMTLLSLFLSALATGCGGGSVGPEDTQSTVELSADVLATAAMATRDIGVANEASQDDGSVEVGTTMDFPESWASASTDPIAEAPSKSFIQSTSAEATASADVPQTLKTALAIGRAQSTNTTSSPTTTTTTTTTGSVKLQTISGISLPEVWRSDFVNAIADWPGRPTGWGEYNRSYTAEVGISGRAMNVFIPKGSIDPGSMKMRGLPYGGTGFKSLLPGTGYDLARLSYKVRFPVDFQQARGGKLPGLCGGVCNGGGVMPTGTDGFSARYMWTGNFAGSVYAYLPTSVVQGTPIGSRQIPLDRGRWIKLTQEIKLNKPGHTDGYIKVWSDDALVVDQQGLTFRTTSTLKVDRIYFDVFYGGSDDTWAAPQDTTIQFAEFRAMAR